MHTYTHTHTHTHKQGELARRYSTHGVVPASATHGSLQHELRGFTRPSPAGGPPRVESVLLTAGGRGAGVTAMGAWAAAEALKSGSVDYARIVTAGVLCACGGVVV